MEKVREKCNNSVYENFLNLVDLAGSERLKLSNTVEGEARKEAININLSLNCLARVIKLLAQSKGKKAHIPYRDSILTYLLKVKKTLNNFRKVWEAIV